MVSHDNGDWILQCGLIEDISSAPADGDFYNPNQDFGWPSDTLNVPGFNVSGQIHDPATATATFIAEPEPEAPKESGSKKRGRSETCAPSSSKACREKLRRDRLNEKFMQLGSILEPDRPPKTDKAAILSDAVRLVTQLRTEAQNLKDSNSSLQEQIKDLKVEKNELRDEKQRLKVEKEKLEMQLKSMNTHQQPPSFLPPPGIPAAFAPQHPPAGGKLVPFMSYPGVAMWQFMPPAAVDTSQDHALRPPVA